MDVGNHTTTGDGGLDEGIQLLVTTDGKLQVTGRDTLHLYATITRVSLERAGMNGSHGIRRELKANDFKGIPRL